MHKHNSRNILHHTRTWLRLAAALLVAAGAAACTDEALLSPGGARPLADASQLFLLTPDSAVVGDTGVVLTVRGSGFTESSQVLGQGLWLTTTFVDDSTLTARIENPLWQTGTYELVVYNELWEASDPLPFVVGNPVPVITRTTPDWCATGYDACVVRLEGRGFTPEVEVRWNGSTMNHSRLSDSVIVLSINGYSLQYNQVASITVINPGPGGGTSAPAILQVGMRVMLHTAGARTGTAGFELEVYGEQFSSDAVLYWNGTPLQTQYSNPRRLAAYVPASRVAAAGEGVVTLSTWQLGGGDPWRVGTITVRPQPAATVTSQLALDLPVRDVAYSPVSGNLYATVYENGQAPGAVGGTVAVIDPETGMVENNIWVGANPRYMALSSDGRYLWVGVDGENRLVRIRTEYDYPDAYVQLDSGLVAEDLAPVPGKPHRVAVALRNTCCSPRHAGIAVYDAYQGIALPNRTAAGTGSNVIEFGAGASTLYGLDNETTGGRYRTLGVDDNGVTVTSSGWNMGAGLYADMAFANGRVYTTRGYTVDTGYNDWAGFFSSVMKGAVRPDVETGRVFFLDDDAIHVADINTFATLGSLPVPPLQFEHPADQRRHLVRWGADGLAFHDADQLFILRSPIAGP